MKGRIIKTLINTGSVARDYIRQVCGGRSTQAPAVAGATTRGASRMLEVFRDCTRQQKSDYILTGGNVIRAMDEQLQHYRTPGEEYANAITRGCSVSISGDDRRFTVMAIWWDDEAIKVKDDEGHVYVVPFKVIGPWPREDDE